ncbi:hypothetical protein D3C87_2050690 [compost metagenome]
MRRGLCRSAEAVRLVVDGTAAVVPVNHSTIALVIVNLSNRPVDRQLVVIGAYAVTVGIPIGEEAALQHFIG